MYLRAMMPATTTTTGIATSSFRPAWWLPGPHLQTLWAGLCRRPPPLKLRRERLELPDGDFVDLDWIGEHERPIVIVLHGLEGSIKSRYAAGIMAAIHAHGWRGVLMHFRGCSGDSNRLPRCYHSGDTGDLSFLRKVLRAREPTTRVAAVGFSLGGNVLLKYLGETRDHADVATAVAVSVPFDLNNGALRLERGFSQLYQWKLLHRLRSKTREKFKRMPSPIPLDGLSSLRTFRAFDDAVTARLHGFSGVEDYYGRSSSRRYLSSITVPTLILHAVDDPFMTPTGIPEPRELSPSTRLELSLRGGHVGFVAGALPGRPHYWLEERIPQFLALHLT